MMKHTLRLYPDYMLRAKAAHVDDVDSNVRALIYSMEEIMHSNDGIGLAAPQVGVLQRVIIADTGEGLLAIANPEIVQREGQHRLAEGCLSLPDIQVEIERNLLIAVDGINGVGQQMQLEFSGLMARVIQHEIDHLDGRLIIDYASPAQKILLRKKLKNLKTMARRNYRGY
jgi:peptide deformylase